MQRSRLNKILVFSLLPFLPVVSACQPPGDPEKPDEIGTEEGLGGGETGVEEDDFKSDGYCLVEGETGVKGYVHHCGGNLAFEVEGQYYSLGSWHPTSFHMNVGFGPTYADDWLIDDDTYDHPLVAACCGGPMDFDNKDPEYPNAYQLNCVMDGVQQLCAALPRYFTTLGNQSPNGSAQQQRYWDVAKYLNDGEVQKNCVLALYEENSPDTVVNDRSWQIIDNSQVDYTLTVDFLEILEIAYDEPPAECNSIFDNDDNVQPLIDTLSGSVDPFTLTAGSGQITNNDDVTENLDPGSDSVLATVLDPASGDLQLVNFALKGGNTTIVVDSVPYAIDRWSLRLMTPVTASPGSGGTYTYPPGSMTILATVFAADDAMSLLGTNASTVAVHSGSPGWVVRGFEVEYNDSGTLWTWSQTSDLEFD